MGVSVDGSSFLFGDHASPESVTGVAGPVLLAATVPDLARGDVLAGRYQIEAVIGSGGSGRVLRAFDRVTRSAVALKILRSEFASDPVWTERFSRELRVGRQIQHPNVCRVYDIGEADGHRFLSMELATGGTLRSQMEPGAAPRSVDDRIADARAVTQGVAALHSAGIVHRDLKPENILRTADGRLLVSDFGLATDPGAGPATTVMIGTPRYMAPEVVMGDPATMRADVWALGVVIHEILSGERPNRAIIKRRRRIYTPPEVGSLRERRLVELCARCSEEDPAARPASAVELRREFEAAAVGRRFGNRAVKRQMAWGAIVLATIGAIGLIRNRWTSSAVASSSEAVANRDFVQKATGVPADWSKGASEIATLEGPVHCFLSNPKAGTARIIWGAPRQVSDVDVFSGKRRPTDLAPETYLNGCPQVAPDGQSLLFERIIDGRHQIFWSLSPSGKGATSLVAGSAPLWLPNGEEFVFLVDSSHSAIFSLRTKQFAIIADDNGTQQTTLVDKAIDSAGARMALLYSGESFGSKVVVRALPGLEIVRRIAVPPWSQNLRFEQGKILLSAFNDESLRRLVSVDLASGAVQNVAEVPAWDLRRYITVGAVRLVESRRRKFDLFNVGPNGRARITDDGRSVRGALRADGVLAIQRLLSDGREVIVLRDPNGVEKALTAGPSDLSPAFLAGGESVVFTRIEKGQLVRCPVEGDEKTCAPIHHDAAVPGFPTPDPSGDWIAYVTALNASRVRLVSVRDGQQRDLGAALACQPFWTSSDRLWVVVADHNDRHVWAELDIQSGRATGVTRSVADSSDEPNCRPPDDQVQLAPGGSVAARVVPTATETTRITRAREVPVVALP